MTADDPFDIHEVPRDRWGRPLIKPIDGQGRAKAYTRATTYVGCLEDTFNLAKWQQRMVALGLAARPDLLLAVSAHSDDKRRLDDICAEAREAAAASSAATTGTALHRLAERLDRGEDVAVPPMAAADLDAYRRATTGIDWLHIEQITVHDELKVAGTPDRIGRIGGRGRIYDLKTGSIEWGMGKIAMQLALYARSRLYDIATGQRTDLDVDLERAVIIHLPAGEGRCELVEVDITAGWEAVQLATQVRAWRARKDLASPVALVTGAAAPVDPAPQPDPLTVAIAEAGDVDALTALWQQHRATWTDAHTALAGARKQQLTAATAA
jgi:hypothetical protein